MNFRIPFDSLTLAAVINEVQFLRGSKVQRIIQLDPFSIILGLYTDGKEHQLYLSCHAQFFRCHLLSRRPLAPTEPPAFCANLRKNLGGARLEFIRQRGLDRIIDLGFGGPEGDFQLVAEFMGRHSNLILVDAHRRVIAAAKTVRPNESKRPIRPNHPYEPPPFDPKPPLNEAKPGDNLRDYEGFSPMVDRLLTNGFDLIQIQQAVISQEWQPHFSELAGAYPINFSPLDPTAVPRATLSIALENTFALRETADTSSAQAHALRIQIQRVIDARRTALAGLDEALNTADNAASIQLEAELILAYQGSIKPHQTELEAYDYSGKPLKIRLNPEKNAVENANARFEKAKHAKERRGEVAERHARISHELAAAEALLHDLDLANSPEDLERIHATAKIHNFLHEISAPKAKEDRPYEGFSIRELTSPSGYRVLYGTNATSNDYLTNRVAKGNDIWLHVRGQTSAHVIIQSRGEPDRIQRSDLEFAAIVSARNSVAKHGSYVPVDYTLKKYVRKPRGSAPGLAVYEREKTIHVDP